MTSYLSIRPDWNRLEVLEDSSTAFRPRSHVGSDLVWNWQFRNSSRECIQPLLLRRTQGLISTFTIAIAY